MIEQYLDNLPMILIASINLQYLSVAVIIAYAFLYSSANVLISSINESVSIICLQYLPIYL